MKMAFETNHLVKKYSDFTLGPLDLSLEPGMVLGFIGPNGAGKTTTLHAMMGLIRRDEGSIHFNGLENDPEQTDWKQQVGFVGESHAYYERWSVEQNLACFSRFYPNWSRDKEQELCRRFELDRNKKVKSLSKGNRVKLALVKALSYSPQLLLLDEPTAGLDPVIRAEVLDALFEVLEDSRRSIFYSTHILSDISRLADELAFIKNGQLILREYKDEMINRWRKISFTTPEIMPNLPAIERLQQENHHYLALSSDFEKSVQAMREFGAENIEIFRLTIDEIAVQILKGDSHGNTDHQ